jgi:hypothetical protein
VRSRAKLDHVAWPGALETAHEIEIETRRGADAPAHRTIIWPVVEEGEVYVRSLRGDAGRWYREALANPDVVVHVDGQSFPARAIHAPDPESVERANAGLQRKYADSPSLETMVRQEILETTLRLEPR